MEFIANLLTQTTIQVWTTFLHNWPFLVVSVVIAVILKLYVNPTRVSAFLMRYRKAGVVGATAAAVATPLCSCGTTAIILGMMASTVPWAPIIAFMVASPLTSPEELIYSAGLFGWPFALAFFVSSIILGLVGGFIGEFLEQRGWLANQSRFSAPTSNQGLIKLTSTPAAPVPGCACDSAPAPGFTARPSRISRPQATRTAPVLLAAASLSGEAGLAQPACCAAPVLATAAAGPFDSPAPTTTTAPTITSSCGCETQKDARVKVTPRLLLTEALDSGKRLLVMFLGFAFIGYLLNGLIPSEWVARVFGQGNVYSVPLAATLGLPLYINTEASLPLVRALIDGGMSQGAAMAFLITGAGTSIGAFAGALTIARWRVIAVVIGTLWVGAIGMGMLVNIVMGAGIF